jgi:hypothetical protein
MERNENDYNVNEGKGDNTFVLEYPENYNEIVEGMLRKAERECEYIKKFEIKGKSKESVKLKEGDVNSNSDNNNDEEDDEQSDNDNNQYIAFNDENDDDNSIHSNNSNEQQPLTHTNTNITSPPLSQHIPHNPLPHNSTQPNINSSKIKQMLSKVNIPAPSWASSLSDEAFLNLILPSLNQ